MSFDSAAPPETKIRMRPPIALRSFLKSTASASLCFNESGNGIGF